jgi:HSP20 family protein
MGVSEMAEKPTKPPTRAGETLPTPGDLHPLSNLRREVDRLFEDFPFGPWRRSSVFDVAPFWRGELSLAKAPAVDVAEKEKEYEIPAELPGMGEKDIDVKFANGMLTIKGEKKEEKEEKRKDYHLSERRFGSFQRSFTVPEDVDVDKIDASFKNGVLTVVLPKSEEAQKREQTIEIKKG